MLPDVEETSAWTPELGSSLVSFAILKSLLEEIRDAAWWKRKTLTALLVRGIELMARALRDEEVLLTDPNTGEQILKKTGEPYPPRRGELRVGRPQR